mmetsp:Transcript_99618/g.171549  ORF Transcript_99618/g.171549 Transcript_99618/m.171549 type:complete len:419 (-) Transcript_99618:949-2205(-)
MGPGVHDVLAHHVLGDDVTVCGVGAVRRRLLLLCPELILPPDGLWVVVHVRPADKLCQGRVLDGVHFVPDDVQQVEALQDRLRQVHVLLEGEGLVVVAPDGVGRRDDGAPGLEGGDDAGLRDGDGLLLHRLVDGRTVAIAHLVKLVDHADPAVRNHQGPPLQSPLPCSRVWVDSGRQPYGGAPTPRRENGAVGRLLHVLQELGLGAPGIPKQEDVDVPADLVLPGLAHLLLLPRHQRQQEPELDVLMAVDGGSHGLDQLLCDLRVLGQPEDLLLLLIRQLVALLAAGLALDVVRLEVGGKHREPVLVVEERVEVVLVDARHLDLLAGFGGVDEVVQQHHLHRPWQPSGGNLPGGFLEGDGLVVAEYGPREVHLECIPLLALGTRVRLHLLLPPLHDGADGEAAHEAVEDDVLQLREDH